MKLIFIIIFFIILLRTLYSNIMLVISLFWLKYSRQDIALNNPDRSKEFIVIIPVLREQKILKRTLEYFLKMKYDLDKVTIILVSTEKEIKESVNNSLKRVTTIDLIKKLKQEINQKYKREIIVHLHYPSIDGKMAHQVNYAFDYILRTRRSDFNNLFVVLYNADSRPDLETFTVVSSLARNSDLRVFQQSALFLDNLAIIRAQNNFFIRQYLVANAILHSRWTLAHEIPRLLRQSFFINHFNKKIFLSHCVGHGLFLRGDFLQKVKTMPTITVTEDLFFGYILSALGESINPLPVLESAEAPATISSAMKQKYVWFFGPLDHFSYEKFFKKRFSKYSNNLFLKWLTFQGILPAFAWFFMGWLILFVLLYPLFIHNYQLFFGSVLLWLFYGPFSYIMVLIFSQKMNKPMHNKYADYFWLALFSLPAVVAHSMPTVYTLYVKIYSFFTKKEPFKPKTER